MQLFIKGISKYSNCTIQTLNDIEETDTLRSIYVILNNMFGIEHKHYYLYYNSHILEFSDNKTLKDCDIQKESTIQLHFRMHGKCIKKKK